tara:strand:+ start:1368 stop:2996 length:1629 start_codon:yes stop_codon:yes gene_type:complete
MNLIIGKNSKIVKSLGNIENFSYISHEQVDDCQLSKYDKIFIFSHSPKSEEYINFLNKLPITKVIFISTTAVLANFFRKQPFLYPKTKEIYEKFILENGGKVVRLGIFDDSWVPLGLRYPKTTTDQLISFIKQENFKKVENLYDLKRKDGKYNKNILDKLEDIDLFYLIIASIKKLLKIYPYGYNRDSLKAFNGNWLVGNGALGNQFYKDNAKNIDYVLVSNEENKILRDNGFQESYIGKTPNGLRDLWHSVKIIQKDTNYFKSVPLFNRNFHVPENKKIYRKVDSIILKDRKNYQINSEAYTLEPEKIVLAAGPIENVRILSSRECVWTGTDHEIYFLGQVDMSEAILNGYIKSFGPLILRGPILTNRDSVMLDFRPGYRNLSKALNSGSFFTSNTKSKILSKVLLKFDFERLNEALFNKFGFAFKTKNSSIFVQKVHRGCIKLKIADNKIVSYERSRFTINNLLDAKDLIKEFSSFIKSDTIKSIDAQHIIIEDKIENIEQTNLVTIGSPTVDFKLDAFHHTIDMYQKQKIKTKNFLIDE